MENMDTHPKWKTWTPILKLTLPLNSTSVKAGYAIKVKGADHAETPSYSGVP